MCSISGRYSGSSMAVNYLSERTRSIALSGIRVMWEKTLKIPDVIRMDIGEPDFQPPRKVRQALYEAIEEGYTHYSPSAGLPETREAVAEKARRENGMDVSPSEVVITPGGSAALYLSMMATVNPGEEVLIPDPGWAQYNAMVSLANGVPVGYRLSEDKGYMVDVEDLEKKITSKTKMILINTPQNPTGSVLNRKILQEIADLAVERNLLVLSDEVYEKFVFDGETHVSIGSFEGLKNRVITVNSLSKTYAMTGLRIGYVIAPQQIAEEVAKLNLYVSTCANTAVQHAATAALKHHHEEIELMLNEYRRRRDAVYKRLLEIEGVSCVKPKGAFYLFPNFGEAVKMSSFDFAMHLLDTVHVSTVPGSSFGSMGENHLRMACTSEINRLLLGVEKIAKAVEDLRRHKT
ncbi:MAG: pyridoxal phosphate-dependent aminotransferase [Candidatus Caldarchaeum sp.]|nr:pyridoxal phosphate-dependent aminotransferase [Candidatus Caldarchaeum sp.]